MRIRAIGRSGLVAAAAITFVLVGCAPKMKMASTQEEAASMRSPMTGKKASDFTALDQDGKPVKLSSQRGKWVVLYFYPKDDTPGCTCEATEFTKLMGQLRDMNAVVYGISADSPETHKVFIEKYDLGLNLLSDQNHKVGTTYGAWVEAGTGAMKHGRVIRSTFIIDPEGVIRRHWPEVIPTGHAGRVKEWLAKLQTETK